MGGCFSYEETPDPYGPPAKAKAGPVDPSGGTSSGTSNQRQKVVPTAPAPAPTFPSTSAPIPKTFPKKPDAAPKPNLSGPAGGMPLHDEEEEDEVRVMSAVDEISGPGINSFSLEELSAATKNFHQSRKLGEGGFGSVYFGELDVDDGFLGGASGRRTRQKVAIKMLHDDSLQGHKEWMTEVTTLGSLRHPHLVRLLGWCAAGSNRLLVYELMSNGSLDVLLHPMPDEKVIGVLPWGLRMNIALGVAKCLAYLHENRDRPIIYRDLKSANVLLDADFKPKLADFGLAKDGPVGDQTHVSTQVVGTHGYADPDYIITGHLTPKSDVYGFGVLLLELMTGRQALNDEEGMVSGAVQGEEDPEDLAEWALPYLEDRKRVVEIVDPLIRESVPQKGLLKAALLARQCINDSPYERPQMSSVVKTLLSIQHPYVWPPQK